MDTKDQALLADIKSFTLDEGENEVTQILSDDVLRAIRKKIRELDDYPMEETKNRAVIMLGRSGSGKSTACKVIKKITAAQESKSLFSTTVSPRFTSFSLDDRAHQIKYTLSVIDTPGVQEVCPEGQDPRSDDAILETVKYCLKNEVTRLHVLFIFAAFELRITPLDKEAFKVYLDMFYNEKLQIAFCITRAEGRGREWRAKVEEDLRKDSFFGPVLDRPNVKLFFCGVVEQRTIRNAPNPKSLLKKYSEILQMRKDLINFIFDAPDGGVELLKLPIVHSSRAAMFSMFEVQFDILIKLDSTTDFDVSTVEGSVEMFVQNLEYMMENEGILNDPELFALFSSMKTRMKAVAPKMPEELRTRLTSKVNGV